MAGGYSPRSGSRRDGRTRRALPSGGHPWPGSGRSPGTAPRCEPSRPPWAANPPRRAWLTGRAAFLQCALELATAYAYADATTQAERGHHLGLGRRVGVGVGRGNVDGRHRRRRQVVIAYVAVEDLVVASLKVLRRIARASD